MKFSEQWLRQWVNPPVDSDTLCEQLTMAGLEVDGVEPACPEFSGVVVAEVKTVEKHPDADRLSICQVDSGKEVLTIVCGAPNVRAGMKTALAKVGARLAGKPALKSAKLKGVLSHGMLCSASELGLGDDHDGIMELSSSEETGQDLNTIIGSDDRIIEISLTPNRGDCLGIRGIAREVAVLNQMQLEEDKVKTPASKSQQQRTIKLSSADACPRYCGRVIESVDTQVVSPLWLVERLRRSGVRSINIVVDITNYVMLELGQPMHAFDNAKLRGAINVRYPDKSEKLTLLDEQEYELKPGTLVIADDSGPLAMAGIMGGLDSAVGEGTRDIFLESAFFTPGAIIGKARQYGLHTDSSHRFERGVAPDLCKEAIKRATALILQFCGGKPGPVTEVSDKQHIPRNPSIKLRKDRIARVLGLEMSDAFISGVLDKLGMQYKKYKNHWVATAPSHRFDINIEADLIEELVRVHGYNQVEPAFPPARLKMKRPDIALDTLQAIRATLVNRDYQEIISYSFVASELNKLLNYKDKGLGLANPISPELGEMRQSLWPGLLTTLQYNLKRQQPRVRLFETGLVFRGNKDLTQERMLGGLIYGNKYNKQWDIKNSLCDLYDLKMDIQALVKQFHAVDELDYQPAEHGMLHPGQAVCVLAGNKQVGLFGQLHPRIRADLDIPNEVYLFEIAMNNLQTEKPVRYQPISRYPAVARDVAIVIDEEVPLSAVIGEIKKSATNLLTNLELFDVYHGEGIEIGKKSLALGLTFQTTSSTLKDEEVEAIMKNIVAGLNNKFGATLRE